MFKVFVWDKQQIELVNSLIKSTNELVKLLFIAEKDEINDNIFNTIKHIFSFLSIFINNTPEVLLAEKSYHLLKIRILDSYKKVIDNWDNYKDNPDDFYQSWNDFNSYWNDFGLFMERVLKSNNTFFLSLN